MTRTTPEENFIDVLSSCPTIILLTVPLSICSSVSPPEKWKQQNLFTQQNEVPKWYEGAAFTGTAPWLCSLTSMPSLAKQDVRIWTRFVSWTQALENELNFWLCYLQDACRWANYLTSCWVSVSSSVNRLKITYFVLLMGGTNEIGHQRPWHSTWLRVCA